LLVKAYSDNERKEFERTVAAAISRSPGSPVTGVIKAYQDSSDAGVGTSLLNVMSAAGNSEALPTVRQALQDPNADIERAALNALSNWPTPAPMDDLLALARSSGDPTRPILALRGYIKLVQIPSNRTAAETAGLLKIAMATATRPEEKRAEVGVSGIPGAGTVRGQRSTSSRRGPTGSHYAATLTDLRQELNEMVGQAKAPGESACPPECPGKNKLNAGAYSARRFGDFAEFNKSEKLKGNG
jgi:hypothetical protein